MYDIRTIENDEKFLRKKSDVVSSEDISYKEEIKLLKQFCVDRESFAVSSIQLGIPKQIIYFYQNEKRIIDKIMINPKIIKKKGKAEYWEACISVPNKIGLVERPYEIEIEYLDENGNSITEDYVGLDATIISHEIDHLNGVLFIDKAKEIKNMNKDERVEFRKNHPYRILDID